MFITKDPAGFVDGPNLYTYVKQNPWSKFDPEGLDDRVVNGVTIRGVGQHPVTVDSMRKNNLHPQVVETLDKRTIPTTYSHGASAHPEYTTRENKIVKAAVDSLKKRGIDPTASANMTQAQADEIAEELLSSVRNSKDPYVRWFNQAVVTKTQDELRDTGLKIRIKLLLKNNQKVPTPLLKRAAELGLEIPGLSRAMSKTGVKYGAAALKWAGSLSGGVVIGVLMNAPRAKAEHESDVVVYGQEKADRMYRERLGSAWGMTMEELKQADQERAESFSRLISQ